MRILHDSDIQDFLTYRGAIDVLDGLLRSKLNGNVIHPPRHHFPTQKGAMTFTIGELLSEKVAGFRLYASPKTTQLTIAMDTHSGEFKGMIIGKLIGVVRTACLNAVAIKYLARQEAKTLGVLGTGFQARHHALAAMEVREIERVKVYSRSRENLKDFLSFLKERTEKDLVLEASDSPEAVVGGSDILICATNSPQPILSVTALAPGLHINNVGPKYPHKHELPFEAYQKADVLATDSIAQLKAESGPGPVIFADKLPVRGIEEFMEGYERKADDLSLFCSIGLAGSEVALANWILEEM